MSGTATRPPVQDGVAGDQQATGPDPRLFCPFPPIPACATMPAGGASSPGWLRTPPCRGRGHGLGRLFPSATWALVAAARRTGQRDSQTSTLSSWPNPTSPPATHPGELASEQPAPPTVVRTRRRDPAARRGVWPPRTTLDYCWWSRTLIVLGAWLAVSPLGARHDRGPPVWYFQSPVASHHSRAVGLLVAALSAWVLWTGPRTRPPLGPGAGLARQEPVVAVTGRDGANIDPVLASRDRSCSTRMSNSSSANAVRRLVDPLKDFLHSGRAR
jgi:hypothetical protein